MKRLPQNFLSSLQSLEKHMRWGNTILYESIFKFSNASKDDPSLGSGDMIQTATLGATLITQSNQMGFKK